MTIKERFSPENIKEQIVKKVNKAFGKDHNVKIALFKAISEYNDEYDNYNPILILIDKDYNEIEHNISTWDLVPSEEEQWEYSEENDYDTLSIEDITVKF